MDSPVKFDYSEFVQRSRAYSMRVCTSGTPQGVSRFGYVYNLKWGKPDPSQWKFVPTFSAINLPATTNLATPKITVLDQGQIGSCVGNSLAACLQYVQIHNNYQWFFLPSRLWIWNQTKLSEGVSIATDSGVSITDACATIATKNVCAEKWYPYDTLGFGNPIPVLATQKALLHTGQKYFALNNDLVSMKSCLAQGYPFVIGVTVYESFEGTQSIRTGDIPMPNTATEKNLGGHAILIIGYDDSTRRFNFQNSWGVNVGNKGFFTIPYDYLSNANISGDAHTFRIFT